MGNTKFFLMGGIVSITSYLSLIIFLFFYIYTTNQKPKVYSLEKETVFEISLESFEKPELKPQKDTKKDAPKELKNVQKEDVATASKDGGSISPKRSSSNLKSLFADIKVDKPKKIVKEPSFKKDHIASRFKSKDIQSIKKPKLDISKLIKSTPTSRSVLSFEKKPQSGIKDEYYSKIYEILAKHWIPTSDVNQMARVIVIIDKSGNFDYQIKTIASSEAFNQRLREFLEEMKFNKFPPYPKGNKTIIEVYFKTEE